MVTHKFQIGEKVRLQATSLTKLQHRTYEVLAHLPQERGDVVQYRLKSTIDNEQRVALEHSLSRT